MRHMVRLLYTLRYFGRLCVFAGTAQLTAASALSGQEVAGPVPEQVLAQSLTTVPTADVRAIVRVDSIADARASAVRRAAAIPEAASRTRRRLWPLFSLGGAALGSGAVLTFALTHCDAGCQDDGALAFLPPYLVAGALAGAVVGTVVGLIVDSVRSDDP